MTPYIISGLVVGSIYAISALGLVLTYTSSRVFNFAHGAIAYVDRRLLLLPDPAERLEHRHRGAVHHPGRRAVARARALLRAVPAPHPRHAHRAPRLDRRSLGRGAGARPRSSSPSSEGDIFNPEGLVKSPADATFVKVFGTWVNENQFVVIISAVVIAVVATLVLRFTSVGLATRMTVDHPRNAGIAGVNTEAVTAGSWMVGVMLAGFAGVLLVADRRPPGIPVHPAARRLVRRGRDRPDDEPARSPSPAPSRSGCCSRSG